MILLGLYFGIIPVAFAETWLSVRFAGAIGPVSPLRYLGSASKLRIRDPLERGGFNAVRNFTVSLTRACHLRSEECSSFRIFVVMRFPFRLVPSYGPSLHSESTDQPSHPRSRLVERQISTTSDQLSSDLGKRRGVAPERPDEVVYDGIPDEDQMQDLGGQVGSTGYIKP